MLKQLFLTAFLALSANVQADITTENRVYPYQNTALTPEERAHDLVKRLTREEKVALMQNSSPAVERLQIKPYNWWNEALHGVGRAGLATVFPQSIGMAASFDNVLLYDVFTAVSDEARAKTRLAREEGNYDIYRGLTFWTPNINIFRDPRWGRGQETYGEDPYLTGQMGMAVVRGLQGPEDAPYDKAHACAKHFAVHSGPEWNRHSFNAEDVALRDLWETYLPAFKDLVTKAHVKEVMCAYNRYEGDPCCGSDRLLVQILRNEWDYQGIVVSDCGAVDDFFKPGRHGTHPTREDASAHAVLSGTDLECGSAYRGLVNALNEGKIKEEDIDRSLVRLMKARFELGEMDASTPWDSIPATVINSKKHQDLALEMTRKSLVLLENDKGILPLKPGTKVALIGPNANDSTMQWGNYNGFPGHTVTLHEGMKASIAPDKYIYNKVCDHTQESSLDINAMLDIVRDAEVVIFAGGISPRLEGEEMPVEVPGFRGGDRESIELPQVQRLALKALKEAGKRVVLVNFSGSAVGLVPESDNCDAILQAWYPGQAGGTAIADVLTGRYNPAGRLPVTFYKDVSQLPDFQDYSMKGRTYRYFQDTPLYPFGHGLSYTTFRYGKAKADAKKLPAGHTLTLNIPLKNSGKMDGEEVVQVYIRRLADTDGPIKSLRAFRRVALRAGEKQDVQIELPAEAFETFDTGTNTMRVLPGEYDIMYGGTSDSKALRHLSVTLE